MHIKTGTWEANSTVCEPDALYDSPLVARPNPEPPVRNRRLSPGAAECGGGGGGGGREPPPPKGRGLRRLPEGPRGAAARRGGAGGGRGGGGERWGLALLRPPPAFPVQDSPAKLQPAVSYASKVKSGGGAAGGGALGGGAEEGGAIGALLQNRWGLSFFISEGGPQPQGGPAPGPSPADPGPAPKPQTRTEAPPTAATPPLPVGQCGEEAELSGELLLGCRHLVEALQYHTHEWNALSSELKQGSAKVIWYKDSAEQPA